MKRVLKVWTWLLAAIAVLMPSAAFAHTLLCPRPATGAYADRAVPCSQGAIRPRDTEHSRKGTPTSNACGGLLRNANQPVTNLTPGQTVTLKYWNTILHPGEWWFEYSTQSEPANDAAFVRLATVPKPSPNSNAERTITVTIPANVTCQNCTFRLVEVMTENPANPSYYHYCANINIGAASNNNNGTNNSGTNTSGTNTSGSNTSGNTPPPTNPEPELPCSP